MPSLAFFNRCYWPDTEATGQLLQDLCESLAADGNEVHVVCGQPNSPPVDAKFVAEGTQTHNGVTIHRLRHSQFKKRFPAGRLLNLLSFTHATRTYLARSGLTAEVYVSETDPFLMPPVIAKHAQRTGGRFVAYLQDIYPDVAEAIGKAQPGRITRWIRSQLKSAYDQADRVIVLSQCMSDRLVSPPWSIDPSKIEIIPNWADCDAIRPIPHADNSLKQDWLRQTPDLQGKFIVMHSGNMGLTQRLDVLIDATGDPAWPDDAVLMLVGDGAARQSLQIQAAAQNSNRPNGTPSGQPRLGDGLSSRVRFLPYQPRHRLAESLSAADLHVVSMHESITGCLCPSKLYGILAAGRPVLAIAPPETDLVQTVQNENLGWVARPGNAHEVARMVQSATMANPETQSITSRQVALARFHRPVVLQKLQTTLTPARPHRTP